jgi:hypothetical protein
MVTPLGGGVLRSHLKCDKAVPGGRVTHPRSLLGQLSLCSDGLACLIQSVRVSS